MLDTINPRALVAATLATLALCAAVLVGSRNVSNFDAALVAYLFGSLFALFGVVYRYSVWLQRPRTRPHARGLG